jgi:hypothetical protein
MLYTWTVEKKTSAVKQDFNTWFLYSLLNYFMNAINGTEKGLWSTKNTF